MPDPSNPTCSIDEILDELGQRPAPASGVIPIDIADKLFLGGGCEARPRPNRATEATTGATTGATDETAATDPAQNISICVSGPIL